MKWIKRSDGREYLEEDPNFEIIGCPTYIGRYAWCYQGKTMESLFNLYAAKEKAEKYYESLNNRER